MAIKKLQQWVLMLLGAFIIFFLMNEKVSAQSKPLFIHIAKLVVDSAQLENYKAALREGTKTAVSNEPGVITLYGVYEKNDPTRVTVFEIYADEDAYKAHIQSAHFKKYKETVKDMVKSLELVDVIPITLQTKPK